MFPVVLYNGDREWNAKTEIAQCIENKSIPEKYIPKMSYYLIDINKIYNQEMDALVASVVYAEQHSEYNQRENYLKNLENLAQKIIPLELKEAFTNWFIITFTGIIAEKELEKLKYSLEEREGNMLATLGVRIYNEGREEGIEKGRIEVVKNMLAGGLDAGQVAQFSGFSVEEVRRLK